jgi:hypothetical protein
MHSEKCSPTPASGRLPLLLAVALAISGCESTEPTCASFTYSDWGKCSPDGGQTRTVTSSSPAGCMSGGPVLTQACIPEPDGAALYAEQCGSSNCHKPLATNNLKGKNATLQSFRDFHPEISLTDAEIRAILTVVGP